MGTLERHGSHLAFGLDALKVHGLCVRAAEKYGGVVLPPLHWGTHGYWALEASQKLGKKTVEWIVDQLGQSALVIRDFAGNRGSRLIHQ